MPMTVPFAVLYKAVQFFHNTKLNMSQHNQQSQQQDQHQKKTCCYCGELFIDDASNTTSSCKYHPGQYQSTTRTDTSEEGAFACCGAMRTFYY